MLDYLHYVLFKDGRKAYLVFDYEGYDYTDVEYKIVANQHFKVKHDDLIVRQGIVFDDEYLYWSDDKDVSKLKRHYKTHKKVVVVYKG